MSTLQPPASILIVVYDVQANLINGKTSREGHQLSIWEMKIKKSLLFLKKMKLTFQKSSNYGKQQEQFKKNKIVFSPPVCEFARLWAACPVSPWVNLHNCDLGGSPLHTGHVRPLDE